MAKITLEQVKKYNAKMGNGFCFDFRHYAIWGEKRATKSIEIGHDMILTAEIQYSDNYGWQNGFTHDIYIEIVTSIWKRDPENGVLTCGSGCRCRELPERYNKRVFSKIQELTHTITDDDIFAINANGSAIFPNGVLC